MLLRSGFNHYCEVVGRASAIIMLASMGSVLLAAGVMCDMEKIILLVVLISGILAMAQFPDRLGHWT